jgi:hypothetical protein
MDDLFLSDSDQGTKKSRFQRDLEKYGSLDAVRAAKTADNKDDKVKSGDTDGGAGSGAGSSPAATPAADKTLEEAAKAAEREALRALKQLTGTIAPEDNVIVDVNDFEPIEAPAMSEMSEPDDVTPPKYVPRANLSSDVDDEVRTGQLPKLVELSDEFGTAIKTVTKTALSDIKIEDTSKSSEFAMQASKILADQGVRSTDYAHTPRISVTAMTNEKMKAALTGRIILYVSCFICAVLGIAGMILIKEPDPVLFAAFISLVAGALCGTLKFRITRRVTGVCYLFSAAVMLLMGLYKTAVNVAITDFNTAIPLIFHAAGVIAAVAGMAVMIFSRSVRTYYNTDLRRERSVL